MTPRQISSLTALCAVASALYAQEPPPPTYKYEVVSIRAADPAERSSGFGPGPQGGLRARNDTALQLLTFAYDAREYQFLGVPAWAKSDRYEITLTPDRPDAVPTEGPMSREQLDGWLVRNRQRMQAVLRDRFGLVLRAEKRELPMYVLTVAKSGPKLAAPENPGGGISFNINNSQQITARSSTMNMLSTALAQLLGHYVQDETGLDGSYDFKLEFAPPLAGPPSRPEETADTGRPSIFTALTEQTGLRLESKKGPVPVLVIDKLQKPTEN